MKLKELVDARDSEFSRTLQTTLNKYSVLSKAEEEPIAKKAFEGCETSRDLLVFHNLRFAIKWALDSHQGAGIEFTDATSVCILGLIKASKRFDYQQNTKFISYAVWWMRAGITQASRTSDTVLLPANRYTQRMKIRTSRSKLYPLLERIPTVDDISRDTGIDVESIRLINSHHVISINGPIQGPDKSERDDPRFQSEDFVSSCLHPDYSGYNKLAALNALINTQTRELIKEITLSKVDQREAFILDRRFGLGWLNPRHNEPQSLESVGKELGISRERVRQLQARAISKIEGSLERLDITSMAS